MKRLLILLTAVLQTSFLFATGSTPDIIDIDGEKWCLMEKPLDRNAIVYTKLMNFLPDKRVKSSANWDGYTACWQIIDNHLYLQKIIIYTFGKHPEEEEKLEFDADTLTTLFAPYCDEKGICASWYSGEMRAGRGKIIRYIHMAFERNMEEEYVITICKGTIVKKQRFHNYRKEGFNIGRDQKELEKRFPFEQFPETRVDKLFVTIKDLKVSPEGYFLDCHLEVISRSPDRTINDQNHPVIKAFKTAMKNMYPWESLYVNGKYTTAYDGYSMPLWPPVLIAHSDNNRLETGVPVCYLNVRRIRDTVIPYGKYKYCNSDTIRHIGFVLDKEIVCIDNKGRELFDVFRFGNGPDPVKEGLFRIKDEAGKIGYADTLGRIIIKPQFAFACPFENGKAKVTYSGEKPFTGESKEQGEWKSNYWFYIDFQGDFIRDEITENIIREYAKSNEFISITPKQYFKSLSDPMYSKEEIQNSEYQIKAAFNRLYEHCTTNNRGFITYDLTKGKEINISEELFQLGIKSIKSHNKTIEKWIRDGIPYKTPRLEEEYFNNLLKHK